MSAQQHRKQSSTHLRLRRQLGAGPPQPGAALRCAALNTTTTTTTNVPRKHASPSHLRLRRQLGIEELQLLPDRAVVAHGVWAGAVHHVHQQAAALRLRGGGGDAGGQVSASRQAAGNAGRAGDRHAPSMSSAWHTQAQTHAQRRRTHLAVAQELVPQAHARVRALQQPRHICRGERGSQGCGRQGSGAQRAAGALPRCCPPRCCLPQPKHHTQALWWVTNHAPCSHVPANTVVR